MPATRTNPLNLSGTETVIDDLAVEGTLPGWLSGSLVRNGPVHLDTAGAGMRHWFDGTAMLHRFSFTPGKVAYAGKFLKGKAFQKSQREGKPAYREFATDPCQTLFGTIKSLYLPEFSDNASVNVGVMAERYVALSETPLPLEFDPLTLDARSSFNFQDKLAPRIALTTAHPHYDYNQRTILNYGTQLGGACRYNLYYLEDGSQTRRLMASVPVSSPAYMHTFAHTPNYVILAEFPLLLTDPLQLGLGFRPFIENFAWQPEKGVRFIVISKALGKVEGIFETESFFAFHHVNACEQQGEIVLDVAAYPDNEVIEALYLDRLSRKNSAEASPDLPTSGLRRYRLQPGRKAAHLEIISEQHLELPRINYRRHSAMPYRWVYGVSRGPGGDVLFENQLVKIDAGQGSRKTWQEANCYPGEPVFVAAPGSRQEDEGVVLSVVLDSLNQNSFLLVLDAASFTEKARARVPLPVPMGLHGDFFQDLV